MDRYLIEVRGTNGDFTYPDYSGMEIAESVGRAVEQILALVDEVDEIRVTRFNSETPARDVTDDLLHDALLEWNRTHNNEHSIPHALQAAYDASNIMRMAV